MNENEIEGVNQQYYDQLYGGRNRYMHLIHSLISFDQQSKSKPNWLMLRQYLLKENLSSAPIRLLDYGSGWGTFILKLPRNIKPYCFDISLNSMEMLRETMSLLKREMHFVEVNNDKGIQPKDFNVVTCSHVLEHVPDDIKVLEMFAQALVPKGVLLVNVPINEVWKDPKHIRQYTSRDLIEKMYETGFEILEIKETDKWSGFLLDMQINRKHIPSIGLRILRLFLAILPQGVVDFMGRIFLKKYPYQQLLIVGKKND